MIWLSGKKAHYLQWRYHLLSNKKSFETVVKKQ